MHADMVSATGKGLEKAIKQMSPWVARPYMSLCILSTEAPTFSLPQAQALGRVFITPVRRAIELGLQSSACGLWAHIIAQASKPTGPILFPFPNGIPFEQHLRCAFLEWDLIRKGWNSSSLRWNSRTRFLPIRVPSGKQRDAWKTKRRCVTYVYIYIYIHIHIHTYIHIIIYHRDM